MVWRESVREDEGQEVKAHLQQKTLAVSPYNTTTEPRELYNIRNKNKKIPLQQVVEVLPLNLLQFKALAGPKVRISLLYGYVEGHMTLDDFW